MPHWLLGVDVGTTGVKALLVDEHGRIRSTATRGYPMQTPRLGWAEQDPLLWWRAAQAAIRQVAAGGRSRWIAAVGLTGQMHGLVMLDRPGRVIRPCILWNDQRSAGQCRMILRRIGLRDLIRHTGNTVLPGFTAPKLMWVREHEPAAYRRTAKVLLPKDYIRFRLTGEYWTDVADASGTSLFDVGRRQWSEYIVKRLRIPRSWLPGVTESPSISAYISPDAARQTGLRSGTPVVGGGGDQACQAVGAGIVDDSAAAVTIGTSGVVFAVQDRFRPESKGRLHAFCHAVPGLWHLMGVMLSAGGSFRWLRDCLGRGEVTRSDAYQAMTAEAASVPAGCEGLIFLPYVSGERTPYADPDARGVFFGLSLRHSRSHLIRAVMEGVAFGLLDSMNLLRGLGIAAPRIRVTGGGSRSRLWRQIIADVFSVPVEVVEDEGAAYGAALVAGVGARVFPSAVTAARSAVRVRGRAKPGPASPVYPAYYRCYRDLYQSLRERFGDLARLTQ